MTDAMSCVRVCPFGWSPQAAEAKRQRQNKKAYTAWIKALRKNRYFSKREARLLRLQKAVDSGADLDDTQLLASPQQASGQPRKKPRSRRRKPPSKATAGAPTDDPERTDDKNGTGQKSPTRSQSPTASEQSASRLAAPVVPGSDGPLRPVEDLESLEDGVDIGSRSADKGKSTGRKGKKKRGKKVRHAAVKNAVLVPRPTSSANQRQRRRGSTVDDEERGHGAGPSGGHVSMPRDPWYHVADETFDSVQNNQENIETAQRTRKLLASDLQAMFEPAEPHTPSRESRQRYAGTSSRLELSHAQHPDDCSTDVSIQWTTPPPLRANRT